MNFKGYISHNKEAARCGERSVVKFQFQFKLIIVCLGFARLAFEPLTGFIIVYKLFPIVACTEDPTPISVYVCVRR